MFLTGGRQNLKPCIKQKEEKAAIIVSFFDTCAAFTEAVYLISRLTAHQDESRDAPPTCRQKEHGGFCSNQLRLSSEDVLKDHTCDAKSFVLLLFYQNTLLHMQLDFTGYSSSLTRVSAGLLIETFDRHSDQLHQEQKDSVRKRWRENRREADYVVTLSRRWLTGAAKVSWTKLF